MPGKQSLSFALEPRGSLSFDDYIVDCAWSPDATRLALAGGEGRIALVTFEAALTLCSMGEHLLGTLAIAWQPRAQRFATSGQDGAVALWDAATATQLKRWKPAAAATQSLAWSPGGDMLAAAAGKVVSLWS